VIRTKAEIIKSMGTHGGTLHGLPDNAIERLAIMHAGVNIKALSMRVADPFGFTGGQLESMVNCLLDCEERLRDIGSGNDD
jgi:hypothetical protein